MLMAMLAMMKWGWVINTDSGGGAGRKLFAQLRALAPQLPCCDVQTMDLVTWMGTHAWDLDRIMVAGGDGSAHWVWHLLAEMSCPLPVALWPLGTGNDLAIFLGHRRRPAQTQQISATMAAPLQACSLDRFLLEGPGLRRSIFAYLSLGLDARIALLFDRGRKRMPCGYRAPCLNKLHYGRYVLSAIGRPLEGLIKSPDLCLPRGCQGLIWANIPNFAGGAPLSPESAPGDGRLSCHAYGGLLGLGLGLSPWRRLRSLAHGVSYQWHSPCALPLQIDGEPLVAPPGSYTIRLNGQVQALRPS
ncbi:MAG: hypothetical protein EA402_13140 [Planctomycetota bacterium]|nr:MAG: hypothetical protein EA402_13140 [Planctomycetota bacterium]